MSASEHDDSLPERVAALLDGWPAPSRGALEWEDAASTVMERVRSTAIGSTPDDLLAPPSMGEERGDERGNERGEESLSVGAIDLDEPGLADIARAALAGAGSIPAQDIARAGLLAAERDRLVGGAAAEKTEVAAGAADLQSRLAPLPAPRLARLPPVAAVHTAIHASAAESEHPPPSSRTGKAPGFGAGLIGGAALAFAAAAALYLSVQHRDAERVLSATSSERAAAPAPHSVATPSAAAAPERAIASLEDLPAPPPTVAGVRGAPSSPPPLASQSASQSASKSAPQATGSSTESLAFRVKPAPKGASKLVLEQRNDSPVQAEPEQPGNMAPAPKEKPEPAPGLPAAPSLGALQAAVGSVMAGARGCLAGQDAGSKATVVFGSDGRVSSVAVSGPAAGTPAEPCLRSALSAARVPPFSDSSYSASLTIRPM